MVLSESADFVVIKDYKPPPQHVVSYKKREHEARAEAAQHQFRCVSIVRSLFRLFVHVCIDVCVRALRAVCSRRLFVL